MWRDCPSQSFVKFLIMHWNPLITIMSTRLNTHLNATGEHVLVNKQLTAILIVEKNQYKMWLSTSCLRCTCAKLPCIRHITSPHALANSLSPSQIQTKRKQNQQPLNTHKALTKAHPLLISHYFIQWDHPKAQFLPATSAIYRGSDKTTYSYKYQQPAYYDPRQ